MTSLEVLVEGFNRLVKSPKPISNTLFTQELKLFVMKIIFVSLYIVNFLYQQVSSSKMVYNITFTLCILRSSPGMALLFVASCR